MACSRTYNEAVRDRARREFEEAERKMVEEVGEDMPVVTAEEEADKAAVEWEKGES